MLCWNKEFQSFFQFKNDFIRVLVVKQNENLKISLAKTTYIFENIFLKYHIFSVFLMEFNI